MTQAIAELRHMDIGLIHARAHPSSAEPGLGGDGPPRQIGAIELAQVAGDDAVVLQRPIRPGDFSGTGVCSGNVIRGPELVRDLLQPEPEIPLGLLDDAETPWCG